MVCGILEPDLIDRQRCKGPNDECPQYLPGEPLRARARLENDARFGSAPNGIDLLKAADADLALYVSHRHREEEPLSGKTARQDNCLAKTAGSALRGQWRTYVAHRVRVREQLAIQRLVGLGQRADVEPLRVYLKHVAPMWSKQVTWPQARTDPAQRDDCESPSPPPMPSQGGSRRSPACQYLRREALPARPARFAACA